MKNFNIVKFEKVALKNVFGDEATGFTPWLAHNLDMVGEQLGMNLELVGTEIQVDGFRLDILCKDVKSGKTVVIENQYDALNHDHIGKAFSYRNSTQADVVVWVAEGFRKGTINCVDELNRLYSGECQFWAFKVGVNRVPNTNYIDTRFEAVVRPSNFKEIHKNTNSARRSDFKFSMIGLKFGDEINFEYDKNIIVRVADDSHIEYNGNVYSLTKFCREFKSELFGNPKVPCSSTRHFLYKGKRLNAWRKKFEKNA